MQNSLIRFFDILLSLVGIIGGLPLFLLIFLLILFDSGSPFFMQSRVGRNQNLFTVIKFRTMHRNTQSVGTHLVDSTSVTRLGKFLRKSKLDELPQLINVLRGQMSLVGPRPCLPNQTDLIQQRGKRDVFSVRPGLTGLAQVNSIDMSTPRKLAVYDRLLIQRLNLGLYFKLIGMTVIASGQGDRIRSEQSVDEV